MGLSSCENCHNEYYCVNNATDMKLCLIEFYCFNNTVILILYSDKTCGEYKGLYHPDLCSVCQPGRWCTNGVDNENCSAGYICYAGHIIHHL